jgi:hypothetical protein
MISFVANVLKFDYLFPFFAYLLGRKGLRIQPTCFHVTKFAAQTSHVEACACDSRRNAAAMPRYCMSLIGAAIV